MAYSIMRIKKLKTFGNVAGVAGHHTRDRDTPNANPEQANIWLAGPLNAQEKEIVAAVQARIGGSKIRKNGVIALDIFLGASPEYFRPDDPERPGHYDPAKVEAFNKVALDWLQRAFGAANVVSVVCHLDESTPHVQAVVVPVDPDTGRLNAARWLDGRQRLSGLQDGFAAACWQLGLERGVRGSRATHTRVSEFYAAVNASQDPSLPLADVRVPPAMVRESSREEWAANESARINDEQRPTIRPIADTAASARLARKKQLGAEATAKAVSEELERVKREAGLIRDIPLIDVLGRSGYVQDGGGIWNGGAGRIAISVKGKGGKPRFSNTDTGIGGGGAIDLAMHIHGLDFRSAVAWLGSEFGRQQAVGAALARAKEEAESAVRSPIPVLPKTRKAAGGVDTVPKTLADEGKDEEPDIDPMAIRIRNT